MQHFLEQSNDIIFFSNELFREEKFNSDMFPNGQIPNPHLNIFMLDVYKQKIIYFVLFLSKNIR